MGPFGAGEGRAGLLAALAKVLGSARWSMSFHTLSNPVLEVDGDRATGRWYMNAAVVMREDPASGIQQLFFRYEDDYVRTPQGWKIQRCRMVLEAPPADG